MFEPEIYSEKGAAAEKRLPYNQRERKVRNAPYRNVIRAELAEKLYRKILDELVRKKKYKDSSYSAKELAKELHTSPRYLSAVINSRFGKNYSCLLNEYRIKDACRLLLDQRYADRSLEDIGVMAGFTSRQSFYAAFYKNVGKTPGDYRKSRGRM